MRDIFVRILRIFGDEREYISRICQSKSESNLVGKFNSLDKQIMSNTYDVCVVGAGIMGSATARHLAKLGQKTLLLEQFPLPHWRGSSHGQTRICRLIYTESYFMKMADDAKTMWKQIEEEAGEKLMQKNVGELVVEEPPCKIVKKEVKLLKSNNIKYEVFSPKQLKDRFPELHFAGYSGVLEHSACVLMADKCLKYLQNQFIDDGGTIQDGQAVSAILPDINGVTIKTHKATYRAKKVILTVGPWTNKLLEPLGMKLPLKVCKAPVLYWKIVKPDIYSLKGGFPCFFDTSESDGRYIFALPSLEYPGLLKLGPTGESQSFNNPSILTDPDTRDSNQHEVDRFITSTSQYVKEHFPYVDPSQPAIMEMCLYTMTPGREFIIDKHPRYDNIIIGAGFSGHGFKHAPVVGKILSELALNQTPSYDISHFKISEPFITGKPKSSL